MSSKILLCFLLLKHVHLLPCLQRVRCSYELQSALIISLLPDAPVWDDQANWLHQSSAIHVEVDYHRTQLVASCDRKGTMQDDCIADSRLLHYSSWGKLQYGIATSKDEGPSIRTYEELLNVSSQVAELPQENFILWFNDNWLQVKLLVEWELNWNNYMQRKTWTWTASAILYGGGMHTSHVTDVCISEVIYDTFYVWHFLRCFLYKSTQRNRKRTNLAGKRIYIIFQWLVPFNVQLCTRNSCEWPQVWTVAIK